MGPSLRLSRGGKGESPLEMVWRYRGLVALVSVPVLLIATIALLMPRGPAPGGFHDAAPVVRGGGGGGGGGGAKRYAVVVDAGSTGSRVHAFAFAETADGGLDLLSDTFEQLKPGLSSYAAEPAKGAASLKPLLERAVAAVPEPERASTPVQLRATAGLRLLPGDQAEELLAAVRELLGQYPFRFMEGSVSIMGGADEGAFQWLTLNYLLGNLGGGIEDTVAVIDLGGGSVQLAHAISDTAAAAAPQGYVRQLSGGGMSYDVYVHSYLGYGLMAARAAVLKEGPSNGGPHPCLHKSVSYTYGGETVEAKAAKEGAPAGAACAAAAALALRTDASCAPAPAAECGFAGAWGGGGGGGASAFYVSSYFWDRAQQAGAIPAGAIDAPATPRQFGDAASAACAAADALQASFPAAPKDGDDASLFCLDLAYCHTLLTTGFGLEEDAPITLVKQVKYKGDAVEAAWPLGAAIDALGAKAPAAHAARRMAARR